MVQIIKASGAQGCKRALVLLLDESYSIGIENWKKQVLSTADAINRPDVAELLASGGGTAISVISFDHRVRPRIEWQVIRSQEDADAFSAALRTIAEEKIGIKTDIGNALHFALDELQVAPCQGRPIIDISTDADNDTESYFRDPESLKAAQMLKDARKRAINEGVTINGIGVDGSTYKGDAVRQMLENEVKTPDGFAMGTSWKDYAEAIYRKLRLELMSDYPAEQPVSPSPSQPFRTQLAQEQGQVARK